MVEKRKGTLLVCSRSILYDVYFSADSVDVGIALIVRKTSKNQRAVDGGTNWLKRIVITWIVLWICSIVSEVLGNVSGIFLNALGMDMTATGEDFLFAK